MLLCFVPVLVTVHFFVKGVYLFLYIIEYVGYIGYIIGYLFAFLIPVSKYS